MACIILSVGDVKVNSSSLTCQLIGAGRAGRAFSLAMAQAGYRFTWIGSKHGANSAKLAQQIGVSSCGAGFKGFPEMAGFLIIAVPDSEIVSVASDAIDAGVVGKDTIAVHLSGTLGSDVLNELRTAGASVMAFHPAQTFTQQSDPGSVFEGICFDMEGDDTACDLGSHIAHDLGAVSVRLTTEQRIVSHLAMTVSSNYTVSLMYMAEEIMKMAGLSPEIIKKMLQPLFLNTVHNISASGTLNALTGPVSRGDINVIKQHLAVLASGESEYQTVYKVLTHIALNMAVKRGDVSEDKAEKIREILERE